MKLAVLLRPILGGATPVQKNDLHPGSTFTIDREWQTRYNLRDILSGGEDVFL